MILKYTSSNGQVFDLKVGKFRTRTADYHNYSWTPQFITQQYGTSVYRFDKAAQTYKTTMSVFGSLVERRQFLNLLHAAFEHDIFTLTPGRITHGMYYIDCFITASNTYYTKPWTNNDLSIYCPSPFWKRDVDYSLTAADAGSYEYLDFPFDYPYDYQATLPGYAMFTNPGVKPADWKIRIKGYAVNPVIVIGDRSIGVNAVIGAGEELVISSRDKTVTKGGANLFNARVKTPDFFDPFTSGEHTVIWSGLFDVDLTIYEERSEPLWI